MAAAWVQALLCLLAWCVVAQATALSAQRVLGRSHHHVAVGLGTDRHDDVDGADGGEDHSHDPSHRHRENTGLSSDHDHPPDDATVVYVQQTEHDHAASQGPVSSRVVADLDGLLPDRLAAPHRLAPGRWAGAGPVAIESHLTRPLERPPPA